MLARFFRFDLVALLTVSCIASPLEPKSRKINWLSGSVVDIGIYAKGATAAKDAGTRSKKVQRQLGRKDLWWEYSIRSGGQTYVGVLRRSPSRCGLRMNTRIKFFLSRDRLYLLNPQGRQLELRILRKERTETIPQQVSTLPADKHPPR